MLVPLFERDGELHLLYTTRSAALAQHAGQVAFPGGRHADGDADLLATALRETEEEIGVRAADVDVLGALDPIHTFSSNFLITPFVGRIPHPYAFRPDPREVHDVFSMPLAVLDDPATASRRPGRSTADRFPSPRIVTTVARSGAPPSASPPRCSICSPRFARTKIDTLTSGS